MKISNAILRDTIELYLYAGSTGNSVQTYIDPVTMPARFIPKSKVIKTRVDGDVVCSASCEIRPQITGVPPQSKIVHDNKSYLVVDVADSKTLTSTTHTTLYLQGEV